MNTQINKKSNYFGLKKSTKLIILGIFAFATFFYSLLWQNVPIFSSDSERYVAVAKDLSDGDIDNLNERAPGFPLIIYLTDSYNHPNKLLWFFQLSLYFLTIWLFIEILSLLNITEKLFVPIILFLLLPPYIENAGYLMTENLAQFCLILTVWGFVKWFNSQKIVYIVIASFAVAYAALTRPTYQILPVFLILVIYLFGYLAVININKLAMTSLILILIFGSIIGGFSYINFEKFGYFGITHLVGYNLCTKTAPFLERLPDEYSDTREYLIAIRDKELVARNSSHTAQQYIWAVGADEVEQKLQMSKADAARYMLKLNITLIKKSPLEYLNQVSDSMLSYWFPSSSVLANMNSKLLQMVWGCIHFILIAIFFIQMIIVFGSGILKLSSVSFRQIKSIFQFSENSLLVLFTYIFSLTIIFYTFFITCLVDIGDPRQRSGDALIILCVIIGFVIWKKMITTTQISKEV